MAHPKKDTDAAEAADAAVDEQARLDAQTPPAATARKADGKKPDETVPGGKIGKIEPQYHDDGTYKGDVIKYYDAFGKPLDEKDHPPKPVE